MSIGINSKHGRFSLKTQEKTEENKIIKMYFPFNNLLHSVTKEGIGGKVSNRNFKKVKKIIVNKINSRNVRLH